MLKSRKAAVIALALALVAMGCVKSPRHYALKLSAESLEQRRLQTRTFDTSDEVRVLTATTGVLQDLGFSIDDTESGLGLVVASKKRDASEVGQIVFAVIIGLLIGTMPPTDDEQLMRASVVTQLVGDSAQRVAVRITFQRIVWNTNGLVTSAESMDSPEFYQEFFDKLSTAMFLQAHGI